MINEELRQVIRAAGGTNAVAARVGASPQVVSGWIKRGVPDSRVIDFCRAIEWRLTPHQMAPRIYPHPVDGMPNNIRE